MPHWWVMALVAKSRRGLAPLLVVGLLWGQATAWADDQALAARLLGRMSEALRSLSYEGTLVYLSDNRLETLHLIHRVEGGRVQERMVSLSGPVRALSREPDRVTCVLADGHPISVKRHGGGNLLQAAPIDPAEIANRYRVALSGQARIAGRDTDVVAIHPRDDLRYGLQFHLDSATGLPLKSDLIDNRGEPIEQLMFTSLVLPRVDDDGLPRDDAAATAPDAMHDPPVQPSEPRSTRWRFDPVPAGFEQAMHDVMVGPGGDEMEHFVFSDRLSAYSIYMESGAAGGLHGVTRIGAIHAAGLKVDGYQVTAVGEVPAATVLAAVKGAHLAPHPAPTPGEQ